MISLPPGASNGRKTDFLNILWLMLGCGVRLSAFFSARLKLSILFYDLSYSFLTFLGQQLKNLLVVINVACSISP